MEAHVWKLMFSDLEQSGAGKKHPACSAQSRINSESFVHSIWGGGSGDHMGLKIKAYRKKLEWSLEGICVSSSLAAVRRAALPQQEDWIQTASFAEEFSYPGFHSYHLMEINSQPFSQSSKLWFYLEKVCEDSLAKAQEKVEVSGSLCTSKPASLDHLSFCLYDRFCVFFFLLTYFFR